MSARPPPLPLDEPGTRPIMKTTLSEATPQHEAVPTLEYVPPSSGRRDAPMSASHVEFSNYTQEKEWANPQRSHTLFTEEILKTWLPAPLRPRFWIGYFSLIIGIAVALEIALGFNRLTNGWDSQDYFSSQTGPMHYVFTLPAVITSMFIASVWAWTDIEIKKMQPYVDLAHGDAPPGKSLLLDYTRTNNFLVWTKALRNKHYTVTLASIVVIITLTLSPLSASVFTVAQRLMVQPAQTITSTATLGLSSSESVNDSTVFLTAAGYASSSVLYGLGPAPWTFDGYTIPPLEVPGYLLQENGTMLVETTAVKSIPGCVQPDSTNMFLNVSENTWHNSAVYQNCNYTWLVDHQATDLFGLDVLGNATSATSTSASTSSGPGCAAFGALRPENRPIVLWFFTYQTKPATSALVFCSPQIEFWSVNATLDLTTRNVLNVAQVTRLGGTDGIVGNPQLPTQAYNGATFASNLSAVDQFVLARQNATILQLPAAVFQAAVSSPAGLVQSFQNNTMVNYATSVYGMYLQTLAQSIYFTPANNQLKMQVIAWKQRVWMSDVAVHLLAAALITIVFVGTIVQLLHRGDRYDLVLGHAPGTIASAVALGGQTDVGVVLAGRQREEEIIEVLKNHRFRIDPDTMKIVMAGEDGYAAFEAPDPRRRTVIGRLQLGLHPPSTPSRRATTRRVARSEAPTSPSSPHTPGALVPRGAEEA